MAKSKQRKFYVVSIIVSFILSVLLSIGGYLVGADMGIFNKDTIYKSMSAAGYYNGIYEDVVSTSKQLGRPMMLHAEVFENVFYYNEVKDDIQNNLEAQLAGTMYTPDTSQIRERLNSNIEDYARKNNIEGQLNLFDMGGDESFQQTDELPSIREFPPKEKLAMEKEALGIYVSGHPLAEYEEQLRRKISNTSMDFLPDEEGSHHTQIEDSTKVIVGGMIAGVSVKYTRNNDKMAFITLEDFQGSMEIVVFPKVYEKCAPLLQEDAVLLIHGRASVSADGEGKVIAADIKNLEQNEAAEIPSSVWLKLAAGQSVPFGQITAILRKYHGDVPVYIYDEKTRQKMKADRINWVTGEDALCEELRQLLGEKNVALKY